ncbi:hypothetical protein SASPL_141986 [Salvia splendens]|uniref:AP2/ERF domain-containing protein n=1 Tax=Salvia splendens TaxID=180675 RepID=A0A8X8WJJ0_SALSN|nr:hypothetical protein SASPL_141986 [Salvia splendens]
MIIFVADHRDRCKVFPRSRYNFNVSKMSSRNHIHCSSYRKLRQGTFVIPILSPSSVEFLIRCKNITDLSLLTLHTLNLSLSSPAITSEFLSPAATRIAAIVMASSSSEHAAKPEETGGGESSEARPPPDHLLLYRGLKKAKKERGCTAKERISRMPPCTAGKRSSIYRGVTRHRWTGRYEAHLWDKSTWNQNQNKKGKQGELMRVN